MPKTIACPVCVRYSLKQENSYESCSSRGGSSCCCCCESSLSIAVNRSNNNNDQNNPHKYSSKRHKLTNLKQSKVVHKTSRYKLLVPVTVALICTIVALGPWRFRPTRRGEPVALRSTTAAANEMFDDANESPAGSADGFNDDDDDDEGAMDASASGDYPDGNADDQDDDPDGELHNNNMTAASNAF